MYLALFFAVGIVAPLVGLVFDRFLFRFLRTASRYRQARVGARPVRGPAPDGVPVVRLEHEGQCDRHRAQRQSHFQPDPQRVPEPRRPRESPSPDWSCSSALTVLLATTALGLRMRAVVESPRLTELAGVNSDRVSMSSWMLSSLIAGHRRGVAHAGVRGPGRIHGVRGARDRRDRGGGARRPHSIPIAYAGGLLLGVGQQLLVPVPADQQHPRERAATGVAVRRAVRWCSMLSPVMRPEAFDRRPVGRSRPTATRARARRAERGPHALTRIFGVGFFVAGRLLPVLPRRTARGSISPSGPRSCRSSSCRSR